MSESGRAAEEQAALRRVATLVAQEANADAVFSAVAREVGEVLAMEATHLGRYDSDGTIVSVAPWGAHPGVEVGARFPLKGDSVSVRVPAKRELGTDGWLRGRSGRHRRNDPADGTPLLHRRHGPRARADVGRDDRHVVKHGRATRATVWAAADARRPPAARRADHQVESNMPGRGTGAISRTAGTVRVSGGGGWLQR